MRGVCLGNLKARERVMAVTELRREKSKFILLNVRPFSTNMLCRYA